MMLEALAQILLGVLFLGGIAGLACAVLLGAYDDDSPRAARRRVRRHERDARRSALADRPDAGFYTRNGLRP